MRHELSDRAHHYVRGLAYDCWGATRPLPRARRGGLFCADARHFGSPDSPSPTDDDGRPQMYRGFVGSGRFTETQIRTIHALAFERLTVSELAAREHCGRQAIVARVIGNSKRQGRILRAAERFRQSLLAG